MVVQMYSCMVELLFDMISIFPPLSFPAYIQNLDSMTRLTEGIYLKYHHCLPSFPSVSNFLYTPRLCLHRNDGKIKPFTHTQGENLHILDNSFQDILHSNSIQRRLQHFWQFEGHRHLHIFLLRTSNIKPKQ